MGGNVFTKPECPVCLVSQHRGAIDGNSTQQLFCNGDVMHVPGRKLDVNGISQCVNDRVNLRAAPATAYSDAFVLALVLGIVFPFFAAPALDL